jgi:hypothetical protein
MRLVKWETPIVTLEQVECKHVNALQIVLMNHLAHFDLETMLTRTITPLDYAYVMACADCCLAWSVNKESKETSGASTQLSQDKSKRIQLETKESSDASTQLSQDKSKRIQFNVENRLHLSTDLSLFGQLLDGVPVGSLQVIILEYASINPYGRVQVHIDRSPRNPSIFPSIKLLSDREIF